MNLQISSYEAAGIANERRFKEALDRHDPHEPAWFCGLDEANALLDMRGVDFIAWVKYPRRREPMPVPIQLKSSEGGKERYLEKHPAAAAAKVVIFVMKHRDKQSAIRSRLFETLKAVREAGVVYEWYLERLRTHRINKKGHHWIRKIEEKRGLAEQTGTPPQGAPPARPPLRIEPVLTPFDETLRGLRVLRKLVPRKIGALIKKGLAFRLFRRESQQTKERVA